MISMAGRSRNVVLYSIRHKTLMGVTVGGVVVCMVLSILLSLYYNFESVTGTHCRVPNFLPTISAAFRDMPSRLVWQLGVVGHVPVGILEACFYHGYFTKRLAEINKAGFVQRAVNKLQTGIGIVHHMSLLTLTLVTSDDEYILIHEGAFIVFMISGFLHMTLFLWLQSTTSSDGCGLKSLRGRMFYVVCNVVLTLLSIYLFIRHNTFCEPYMYSIYAGVEYFVVFTNILFFIEARHDFPDLQLTISGSVEKSD